jgi:hypothetical protein
MRTSFAVACRRVVETITGPEPVGEAMAERLSFEQGLLLCGAGGGHVPWGIQGEATDTWAGYTIDPQVLIGAAQQGSTTRLVQGGDATAFPDTTQPANLPDPLDPGWWG